MKRNVNSNEIHLDNELILPNKSTYKIALLIYEDIQDYISKNEERYLIWLKEHKAID